MSDYWNRFVYSPAAKMGSYVWRSSSTQPEKVVETIVKHEYIKPDPFSYKHLPVASRTCLKLAAVSGMAAVCMSAYGSHGNDH